MTNAQTLVLNSCYSPLKVVDWRRAMTLWAQGKAEIIAEHDVVVRAVTFAFKLPAVVRLLQFVKLKRRPVVLFSRSNVYQRDDYSCQYCGETFSSEDLTFDHVVPAAQGGRRGWENVVSACGPCNRKKGARTPEEAGMPLLRVPRRPAVLPPTPGHGRLVPKWMPYMWHTRAV